LEPAERAVREILKTALSGYDIEQNERRLAGEGPGFGPKHHKSLARPGIQNALVRLHPMYNYEGCVTVLNANPKAAFEIVMKDLEATYVEKQRRAYDAESAHPIELPPFDPDAPIPTATPYPSPTP
jgi:hypothetical protein